jgi:hypothetical protein
MTRPSGLRRVPALLALLVALLGLSGCFKVSQDVKVRADGSGSVTLHAEINKKALAELFDNLGGGIGSVTPDLVTPFRTINRTFPGGTKVRAVDSSERATLDASFDFSDADDYQRKLQEVNEAIAANPDASLPDDGSIDIRRVGDQMDVTLDPGSFASGTGDIDMTALSRLLEPDARPEVLVTITMPGSVLTSNGRAQGRTVTWDLLEPGAPATLIASSEVETAGAPTWALALGIGLIVLVLVVTLTFLVSQRRHGAAGAAGGDPEPSEPSGPWGPLGQPAQPGTGTFFPPQPAPAAQGGWPVPPPRPQAPAPVPSGPPPWQPSPWSFPPATPAPPAPWAGPQPAPPAAPWTLPPTDPTPPAVPEPPPTVDAGAPPLPWRALPAGIAAPAEPTTGGAAPTAELPGATSPVPGWYADPAGGPGLRYWDGTRWTPHTG